jgi:hypothetical protein
LLLDIHRVKGDGIRVLLDILSDLTIVLLNTCISCILCSHSWFH